jgi:hypothetical protein
MSKSSSRPQASVFGALGADDAYFSSRVQVAARDAEQRWPLLGGLSPADAEAPPPLEAGDRSQWAPRRKAEEPAKGGALPARKGLDARLESGLSRLLHQSDAEAASIDGGREEPEDHEESIARTPEAVQRRAPSPIPAPARRVAATPRPRPTQAPEPTPAPQNESPRGHGKLSDVFQRLARPEPEARPTSTGTARPSLLGRLGKR